MSEDPTGIAGYEHYHLLGIQRWYLKIADWVADRLVGLYIDPNVLTLAGIGVAILAAVFGLACGRWLLSLACILIAGIFDMLDGPLARAIKRHHKTRQPFNQHIGAIIDPIADRVCDIAFLGGLFSYVGAHLGFQWSSLVFWTMVSYLLSSWLRTFMGSHHYQVINGKPLTRTVFFAALIVVCVVLAIDEHIAPTPFSLKHGLWLICSSTTLPLVYRVFGGARAVWRAHRTS
ncbi:MAG: CDP-alcohol phosphatidyltransferase family protein [Patescibacteria group bacterium]|nr:CDP-alcohol phosphatidyltransferase family protein [Patescibacteria group bacterium]MDD5715504.1 CDP-alcohol phosphatidyltransferase family protein [Patescibacteria group bacterium]